VVTAFGQRAALSDCRSAGALCIDPASSSIVKRDYNRIPAGEGEIMLRLMTVTAALIAATAVWAQNADGIAVRKETMKTVTKAWKAPIDDMHKEGGLRSSDRAGLAEIVAGIRR
jgi:hypothetical protein